MKRSIKATALAVAMALSGGAWAATSDIIIDIHDPLASGTVPSDFFIDVSAFLTAAPGTPLTVTLTGNTNWTTFFHSADAASLQFFAVGLTQTGITRQGDIAFSPTALANPSASNITAVAQGSDLQVIGDLSQLGVTAPVAGSSATGGTAAAPLNNSFSKMVGISNDFGIAQGSVVGTAANPLSLYYFTTSAAKTSLGTLALNLGTTDTITIGSVSNVPEPGTYALMVAGLLAVGAIVRRRGRS